MNAQEHEYMHAHGIDHDHGHCEHHVDCDHDCAGCQNMDPREELLALMQYMVGHNAAHANELTQVSKRLREMGESTAAEPVLQAVSDFEKGNMRLATVLAAMNA